MAVSTGSRQKNFTPPPPPPPPPSSPTLVGKGSPAKIVPHYHLTPPRKVQVAKPLAQLKPPPPPPDFSEPRSAFSGAVRRSLGSLTHAFNAVSREGAHLQPLSFTAETSHAIPCMPDEAKMRLLSTVIQPQIESALLEGDITNLRELLRERIGRVELYSLPSDLKLRVLQFALSTREASCLESRFNPILRQLYEDEECLGVLNELAQKPENRTDAFAAYIHETIDVEFNLLYKPAPASRFDPSLENLAAYPRLFVLYFDSLPGDLPRFIKSIVHLETADALQKLNTVLGQLDFSSDSQVYPWEPMTQIFEECRVSGVRLDDKFALTCFKHSGSNVYPMLLYIYECLPDSFIDSEFVEVAKVCIAQRDLRACVKLFEDTKRTFEQGLDIQGTLSPLLREKTPSVVNLQILTSAVNCLKTVEAPVEQETFDQIFNLALDNRDRREGLRLLVEVLEYAAEMQFELGSEALGEVKATLLTPPSFDPSKIVLSYMKFLEKARDAELTEGDLFSCAEVLLERNIRDFSDADALSDAWCFILKEFKERNLNLKLESCNVLLRHIDRLDLRADVTSAFFESIHPKKDKSLRLDLDLIEAILKKPNLTDPSIIAAFTYLKVARLRISIEAIRLVYQVAVKDENDFAEGIFCLMVYLKDIQPALLEENLDFFWKTSCATSQMTGIRSLLTVNHELGNNPLSAERSQLFWSSICHVESTTRVCKILYYLQNVDRPEHLTPFFSNLIERVQAECASVPPDTQPQELSASVIIGYILERENSASIPVDALMSFSDSVMAAPGIHRKYREALLSPVWKRCKNTTPSVLDRSKVFTQIYAMSDLHCYAPIHYAMHMLLNGFDQDLTVEECVTLLKSFQKVPLDSVSVELIMMEICKQMLSDSHPLEQRQDAVSSLLREVKERDQWAMRSVLLLYLRTTSVVIPEGELKCFFGSVYDAMFDEETSGKDARYQRVVLSMCFSYAATHKIALPEDCENACLKAFMSHTEFRHVESVIFYIRSLDVEQRASIIDLKDVSAHILTPINSEGYLFNTGYRPQVSSLLQELMALIAEGGEDYFIQFLKQSADLWDATALHEAFVYLLGTYPPRGSGEGVEGAPAWTITQSKVNLALSEGILASALDCAQDGFSKSSNVIHVASISLANRVADVLSRRKLDVTFKKDGADEAFDFADFIVDFVKSVPFADTASFFNETCAYFMEKDFFSIGFSKKQVVQLITTVIRKNESSFYYNAGISQLIELLVSNKKRAEIYADVVISLAKQDPDGRLWEKAVIFLSEGEETEFVEALEAVRDADEEALTSDLSDWLNVAKELSTLQFQGIAYSRKPLPKSPPTSYKKLTVMYRSFNKRCSKDAEMKFLGYIRKLERHEPVPGLANREDNPAVFEAQYAMMENLTSLITHELYLLNKTRLKYAKATDEHKRLESAMFSAFCELEEMSKWCGGRFTDNLPRIFRSVNRYRRDLTEETAPYDASYEAEPTDRLQKAKNVVRDGLHKFAFDTIDQAYLQFCAYNPDYVSRPEYAIEELHVHRGLVKVIDDIHPQIDLSITPDGAAFDGGGDAVIGDQILQLWREKSLGIKKGVETALLTYSLFSAVTRMLNEQPHSDSPANFRSLLLNQRETLADLHYEAEDGSFRIKRAFIMRFLKNVELLQDCSSEQ